MVYNYLKKGDIFHTKDEEYMVLSIDKYHISTVMTFSKGDSFFTKVHYATFTNLDQDFIIGYGFHPENKAGFNHFHFNEGQEIYAINDLDGDLVLNKKYSIIKVYTSDEFSIINESGNMHFFTFSKFSNFFSFTDPTNEFIPKHNEIYYSTLLNKKVKVKWINNEFFVFKEENPNYFLFSFAEHLIPIYKAKSHIYKDVFNILDFKFKNQNLFMTNDQEERYREIFKSLIKTE